MSFFEILTAIVAVVICLLVFIYSKFQRSFQYWKKKNVPYFEPKFPKGNWKSDRGLLDLFDKAYGKGWKYFGFYKNSQPIFVPLDLDLVRCIMSKDFNHFTDRFISSNREDDILTANLFALGGANWRNMRVKLTPTFTSGKLKQMFQTIVDCGVSLEEIITEHSGKKPIDVKDLMGCFTTDVIVSCAFGLESNCFKDPDSPFAKYGKDAFSQSPKSFSIAAIYQIMRMTTIALFPKVAKALKMKLFPSEVNDFYFDFVTKAIDYREKNNFTRNDFLQLLINIKNKKDNQQHGKEGDSSPLTMNQLVAQCFLFFLAGFATSSTTMTFALYELAVHPEIQDKVRKEILKVLEKYDNKICYDAIKDMEYLQQVVEESLRKYPPLQSVPRICNQDYTIPGTDVVIEKGTALIIPIRTIHYMDNHYDNPEKFDPERFSPEEKEARHPYAHIPFGEGPRVCIGMRFGIMQSKVGLVSVLKNHRVKLNPKTQTPITMDPNIADPVVLGGLWLDVEEI